MDADLARQFQDFFQNPNTQNVMNHMKITSVVDILEAKTPEDTLRAADKMRVVYALADTFSAVNQDAEASIQEPKNKLEIV